MVKKTSLENPYVKGAEGRKEWNDRYFNMNESIRHWKLAFFISMGIVTLLSLMLVKMANESHIQPYVVETNQGMPYMIKAMQSISQKDDRIVNFAINQFISNAKTILADTESEKTLMNKVYAYSANQTLSFLRDYYSSHNPFELASQFTTTVKIINVLSLGKNIWQVIWDEIRTDTLSNQVLDITRWTADLTIEWGEVNAKFLTDNPFGLYITHVTWSKNHAN